MLAAILCATFSLFGCAGAPPIAATPKTTTCTPVGRIPIANDGAVAGEFLRSVKFGAVTVNPCLTLCDDGSIRWADLSGECQ